ncbi:ribonuclease activity regulator RraA [Frigidibacter sp. MR17.24]|uniref:ribonuclease activity regulator RraA n=1 Tax=Frigidibacter sp. MR17.24 TaxID=3127345 RepID=UPI003012FC10
MQSIPVHDPAAIAALERSSTATVTTLLLKRGLRNVWMRGTRPLAGAGRTPCRAGPAFTLRFVPMREDLATPESWASGGSTRAAVEAMGRGDIAVVDSGGQRDAGIFGDILCRRMLARGVAGLVTDGALRDQRGTLATGLPVWAAGVAAPPAIGAMTFAGWGDLIGCGGVAVRPGDMIVADDDGAVVIPAGLVPEVAEAAARQDDEESWVLAEVAGGAALPGLYPMNDATRSRYERARAACKTHGKEPAQ